MNLLDLSHSGKVTEKPRSLMWVVSLKWDACQQSQGCGNNTHTSWYDQSKGSSKLAEILSELGRHQAGPESLGRSHLPRSPASNMGLKVENYRCAADQGCVTGHSEGLCCSCFTRCQSTLWRCKALRKWVKQKALHLHSNLTQISLWSSMTFAAELNFYQMMACLCVITLTLSQWNERQMPAGAALLLLVSSSTKESEQKVQHWGWSSSWFVQLFSGYYIMLINFLKWISPPRSGTTALNTDCSIIQTSLPSCPSWLFSYI